MKKLFLYLIVFSFFFNFEVYSDEISPVKKNLEDVFNVGQMISHDDKFTLYFRTREKAVLAKGEELNYITDYPQDLCHRWWKIQGKPKNYQLFDVKQDHVSLYR